MRSIVFQNHGVGDVIMTYPLIRAMSQFPGDSVLVITKSDYEGQIVHLGCKGPGEVHTVGIRDLGRNNLTRFLRLTKRLRDHRPEASIVTWINPLYAGLLSWLSGARIRVGPYTKWSRRFYTIYQKFVLSATPDFHKTDTAIAAAELVGRSAEPDCHVEMSPEEVDRLTLPLLGEGGCRWIALGLGSGVNEAFKRLPLARVTKLVTQLHEAYPEVRLALLGGPGEKQINEAMVHADGFCGVNLTSRTSPAELLAVLKRCAVLISTCSGILHFAAAAQCPAIAFYGPTNPIYTGPYRTPLKAISRGLYCSPCYRREFPMGCNCPICMELDTMRAVTAAEEYMSGPDLRTSPGKA